ncbi:MAG: ABC transporter permease [Acidobacteriaceae bacterium]
MRWTHKLRMRLQTLFLRGRASDHLQDELQFHLDQQIAENVANGMSPEEARSAALRRFGNPAVLRDQAREAWSWGWLEFLLRDLRFGMHGLVRTPGFSIMAILVMGLGIGANVALFTVIHSVLLRPLPFKHPNRLVRVYEADRRTGFHDNIMDGGSFAVWQSQARSFEQMAIKKTVQYDLAGTEGQLPEVVDAELGSWNLFPLLGVQPALGRFFSASDDRPEANATVVLTWRLWKRRYGGDRNVLGKTVLIDAKPYTVLGVLPAWFTYPNARVQLWTPLYHERSAGSMQSFFSHNFDVVGRLKPGVTIDQANAELNLVQQGIRKRFPEGPVNDAINIRPILNAETYKVQAGLYALFAATGCLLLIACLNIANLLIARAATRRRETAIRTALGSSRARILREQIIESLLLSCAGGAVGFLLASGILQWMIQARPDIPRVDSIHIDGIAVLFAVGLMLVCGFLAGLVPALSSSGKHILQALQESSRSTSGGRSGVRLRRMLLSLQIGLTVVLLIGAGLLLKSYRHLRSVDLGCATNDVLTMRINLPRGTYKTGTQMTAFYERLLERVRSLPGVKAAGLTSGLPGDGQGRDDVYHIVDHPPLPPGVVLDASTRFVDPGYFHAMQIPLLQGRVFRREQQLELVPEAVINEALARVQFAGEDPIGKHIASGVSDNDETYEIVGVSANTLEDVSGNPRPTIYYSISVGSARTAALAVRVAAPHDPLNLALPVQKAISGIDPALPVTDVLTMNQLINQSTGDASFSATLVLAFAVISLLLATVGLFGILSYIIEQRTTEIGIRIALGAERGQVMHLILKDGLRPAVLGLVIGLAASVEVARLLQSMLYQTPGLDPLVYLIVSGTLLLAATLACVVPAWRASRVDPMVALRKE